MGGEKMEIMLDVWTYQGSPPPGGEKGVCSLFHVTGEGSPPHRRGKVTGYLEQRRFIGITPAWAGKSAGQETQLTTGQDHPRMGGEKCISA